jgi:Ca2+-dependent lipid-binding protein
LTVNPARQVQGIDPYVKMECAGTKSVSSRVIYSNRYPKWNQQLSLNIQVPVQRGISPMIKVCVYDKDLLGGDDLVATLPFSLRDVVSASPVLLCAERGGAVV